MRGRTLLVLVPALLGGQQDVSTGPCNSCTSSAHGTLLSLGGNRANTDGRLLVDGISIAVPADRLSALGSATCCRCNSYIDDRTPETRTGAVR
jgi:hypothetical protein